MIFQFTHNGPVALVDTAFGEITFGDSASVTPIPNKTSERRLRDLLETNEFHCMRNIDFRQNLNRCDEVAYGLFAGTDFDEKMNRIRFGSQGQSIGPGNRVMHEGRTMPLPTNSQLIHPLPITREFSSRRKRAARSGKTAVTAVVGIVAVLVLGIIGYFVFIYEKTDPNGNDSYSSLTSEERSEYLTLTRQANVALENEHFPVFYEGETPVSGYDFADKSFQTLAEKLPDEELPIVNLAICRYLYARKTKFDENEEGRAAKATAVKRAEEAIAAWLEMDPDAATAHWLQASFQQWKQLGQTTEEVMAGFQKAADLAPDNLAFQVSVFKAAEVANDEAFEKRGQAALEKAYRLSPKNIAIALSLAEARAREQAPELLELLRDLREDIAAIGNQNNVQGTINDPVPRLDILEQQLDDGESGRAATSLRMIHNLVRGSPSYSSAIRRTSPDALEFMHQDLSDEFLAAAFADETAASDPIPVKFDVSDPLASLPKGEPILDAQLADFDMDNTLELFVLTSSNLSVYALPSDSSADGAAPQVVSTLALEGQFRGMLIADLDRDSKVSADVPSVNANPPSSTDPPETVLKDSECDDADVDIVLWGESGLVVLRNDLDRESQTRELVVTEQTDEFNSASAFTAAVLVDIEHDADLDIVAASEDGIRVFLHLGADETKSVQFRPHTKYSKLPDASAEIEDLIVVDWDRDVDSDILVADRAGQQVGYLENLRHGRFQWRSFADDLPDFGATAPIALVEADGNASWDVMGRTDSGWRLALTTTSRAMVVNPLKSAEVPTELNEGLCLADIDNDGQHDLVAWNADAVGIWRGNSDGSFTEDSKVLSGPLEGVQKIIPGDIDNDGDLDLTIVRADSVTCLANDGGNANHWIVIRAIGDEDNAGRSNHHAIGSLIELKTGPRYQAQMVSLQRTHFGLGKNERPDIVRTIWTNGMPQGIFELEPDSTICQRMYLKGSCPFIYTWTGEQYEFLTDCLWAAPIGLQFAEGVMAPSRSWEYLKIPGERLVPIDGEYRIQLTEELWEAAYFDKVELVCIDHPAEIDIYSNEKVGPDFIADYKIHTVSRKQHPVAATDQTGKDVLSVVSQRDDVYFRGFEERIRQGLTTPHHIQLDFGEIDRSQPMMLFLTGWIHPTDTSLNIAFSQDPTLDSPQLPQIWVADGAGGWELLERPMGFPGGKTKTIAVDLSGVFPTEDCRIQIRTSAQIYWDEVFFTVAEPAVDCETQRLQVAHADLHYRGFSQRYPKRPNGPELFDYSQVTTEPIWPPMRGNFTRYGEVTQLLHNEDDQMAILASGDEMTVRFKVPKNDPPEGWKRDFFLHSIGWDKDADLNTVYGQTVEPLPHRQMKGYPYPPENGYPNSEEHRQYIEQYQTRESSFGHFWNQVYGYPDGTE